MPISYQLDLTRNLILTAASGVLTDDDVLTLKRQLATDPAVRAGMSELSDVRGVTDLQVTTQGVRRMVWHDARLEPNAPAPRIAIVATQDVIFGMARMYQQLASDARPEVGIFRDYNEALQWLVVDTPGVGSHP
jgi:hypothetical protein